MAITIATSTQTTIAACIQINIGDIPSILRPAAVRPRDDDRIPGG
jgi:hypothetical protein